MAPGTRIFGPWIGDLSNAWDTIVLQDASGALQAQVTYGDDNEWPVSADGTGHSLVVINENRDIDDWRNWKASPRPGGSPGQSDPRRAGGTARRHRTLAGISLHRHRLHQHPGHRQACRPQPGRPTPSGNFMPKPPPRRSSGRHGSL